MTNINNTVVNLHMHNATIKVGNKSQLRNWLSWQKKLMTESWTKEIQDSKAFWEIKCLATLIQNA